MHVTCYPLAETMAMSRFVKKLSSVFYFQNKTVFQAEDRPADICLKMTFTLIFLILVFSDVTSKPRIEIDCE